MEISIRVPKNFITKQRIEVSTEKLEKELIKFINQLENDFFLDQKSYDQLIEYGINQDEFKKMIKEIEIFASYDENPDEIGFPYEEWIDRLLYIYK